MDQDKSNRKELMLSLIKDQLQEEDISLTENRMVKVVYSVAKPDQEVADNQITMEINSIIYDFNKQDRVELLRNILAYLAGDNRFSHLIALIEGMIRDIEREQQQQQNIAVSESIIHSYEPKTFNARHTPHYHLINHMAVDKAWESLENSDLTKEFILSSAGIAATALVLGSMSQRDFDIGQHKEHMEEMFTNLKKEIKHVHNSDEIDPNNQAHRDCMRKVCAKSPVWHAVKDHLAQHYKDETKKEQHDKAALNCMFHFSTLMDNNVDLGKLQALGREVLENKTVGQSLSTSSKTTSLDSGSEQNRPTHDVINLAKDLDKKSLSFSKKELSQEFSLMFSNFLEESQQETKSQQALADKGISHTHTEKLLQNKIVTSGQSHSKG